MVTTGTLSVGRVAEGWVGAVVSGWVGSVVSGWVTSVVSVGSVGATALPGVASRIIQPTPST